MNNENRKIVKYDPNTGVPIYEDVQEQVQPEQTSSPITEQAVDNSRFQPQQNNSFEQPVVNQINNQQPMMNQYQQPVQPQMSVQQPQYQQPVQPQMSVQQPQYQQPVQQPMPQQQPMAPQMPMQQPQYQQPMQPQNNLNQTSYQPNYENKKSNKGLIIGIIIGIIVLIAVVVVGYFVFFNGNDDKKTDKKSDNKPTTTINDYDDPTIDPEPEPEPEPDPEPEKPTTTSGYISFGHLKYKKYSGYSYSIIDSDMLKITFGTSGKISIFETPLSEVQLHSESNEEYTNYLINEYGFDSVDEYYTFDKDTYKYMITFVEYNGGTYLYFLSSTPNPSYFVEGVMVDPNATDANYILDTLENVLSNIEK